MNKLNKKSIIRIKTYRISEDNDIKFELYRMLRVTDSLLDFPSVHS